MEEGGQASKEISENHLRLGPAVVNWSKDSAAPQGGEVVFDKSIAVADLNRSIFCKDSIILGSGNGLR